jgi:hypothetical protein
MAEACITNLVNANPDGRSSDFLAEILLILAQNDIVKAAHLEGVDATGITCANPAMTPGSFCFLIGGSR